MRLWHQSLIKSLPRNWILALHREVCALRGNGWGKKHATVDYVFKHPPEYLVAYHYIVIREMESRGYKVTDMWKDASYRGKNCEPLNHVEEYILLLGSHPVVGEVIYSEHNDEYLVECIENLKSKGINICME